MGCCLYEMCNLRHAFDAQSINGLAIKILNGSFPPLSPSYSKNLKDLINKMLSSNPKQRPSVWEIAHKPLIKNRIIIYMLDMMNTPHEVEDLYLDTLWE